MGKIQVMRCPHCDHYLVQKGSDYWKCDKCKGEWWPPEKDDTPEKLAKAARAAYHEDVRVGFFGFGGKRSGGSRSGRGSKRKVPVKTQRYILE